jgi:hypothetical protein
LKSGELTGLKTGYWKAGFSSKVQVRTFLHFVLILFMAVVELIAATTTKAGLKVESALATATYERGIKVSNAQMKTLDIQGDAFHF